MKSSCFPSSTQISNPSGVAPGNDSATPQIQLFLSYFSIWYSTYRKVGAKGILVTAVSGFGAGSLCMLILLWLRLPAAWPQSMRVASACFAGAAMSIATYRTLAADRARQSAAVTLAGALLDVNGECTKLIDVDGRMLRVSEYGAALMDAASPLELEGADWLGFWKGDDSAVARSAFAGALAGNRTSFRGLCHTTTGRPKWWDSRLIPIRDDAGRVVAVVCASLDITSQTELLAQLQAKNELISEMEAHMQMVFYSYSANFEYFHYVSAGAVDIGVASPMHAEIDAAV